MCKTRTLPAMAAPLILALLANSSLANQPAITVYNQNFGVVRQTIHLELTTGVNDVSFTNTTAHLEPDSVILRDPAGQRRLQILEQNYRADPLSQELLLSRFEGQEIDFLVGDKILHGRIVRSGYVPHQDAWRRYGQQYYYAQMQYMNAAGGGGGQPIIEIDGRLRFSLPGTPLFPSLGDDTILKPTLDWKIETDADGPLDAELAYVTGGMNWVADYNVIAPEHGNTVDLIGWVTIDNQTGRDFDNAKIKLMAGDVNKVVPQFDRMRYAGSDLRTAGMGGMAPPVSEKVFDEYHLYTLNRATTLRDRETKQVEFVRAGGIESKRMYVYDGAYIDPQRYSGWDWYAIRQNREYGTQSNPKVWVMREFKNSESNSLGIPLPAGRVRFYRQDDDGQLEFTGENEIDHTPKDETVRVYTGNAFDIVGDRRQMDFKINNDQDWLDESFAIRLRNHKDEPVEVRVVEHLYRWRNWEITKHTHDFRKTDARTIEFPITVPPDKEIEVTYSAHYTW